MVHKGVVVDLTTGQLPARSKAADIDVLVDRSSSSARAETTDGLRIPLRPRSRPGAGRASLLLLESEQRLEFQPELACADCHITYEEPDPRLFSFNNPFGACPECQGFGRAVGIDMDLVVPDQGQDAPGRRDRAVDHAEVQRLHAGPGAGGPEGGGPPGRAVRGAERPGEDRSSWRARGISRASTGSSGSSRRRRTRSIIECCSADTGATPPARSAADRGCGARR